MHVPPFVLGGQKPRRRQASRSPQRLGCFARSKDAKQKTPVPQQYTPTTGSQERKEQHGIKSTPISQALLRRKENTQHYHKNVPTKILHHTSVLPSGKRCTTQHTPKLPKSRVSIPSMASGIAEKCFLPSSGPNRGWGA